MSTLTDFFTSLANKIRSNLNTEDTYTPAEAVEAIDDVYDAGEAAGIAATKVGTAAKGDVLSGKTFTNSSTIGETGTMTNNGAVSKTLDTSTTSYTVPAGYHNGSGTVSITTETKTDSPNVSTTKDVTPSSGKVLSKVTINPLSHTGYSPSSSTYTSLAMGESKSIDLGANHDKRYVRVQAAAPSGDKSITSNGTGIDVSAYATATVNVPNPTLSGDAATGNVLSGKTFYNSTYTKQTGTMTNNGAVSPSGLNCGGSYTIPAGYHNGSGVVSANSLSSQTGVETGKTAVTAGAMLSGYQGWVNGSRVSGTISSKSAATYNTSSSDQTISSGQYLSGAQTIKAVTTSGISASNIKDGAVVKVGDANSATRIANVTGTFTDASTVSSGQTAAAAAQIRSGYSAWVDGAEVKGSISSKAAATYYTSSSDQTISSGQYLSGNQTIKAVTTSGISAANIKSGTTVTVGDSNSSTRIANVTGTFTSSSTVSSGQTAAAAAQIKSGYSAWVNGSEVKGSYEEPTIWNLTPSNTSPASMTARLNYMPTAQGYAIESYASSSKTPTDSGTQFDAGWNRMTSGGYAYSDKPELTETTLWTNSNPTSSFAAQTVTLSDSITNYKLLKFYVRSSTTNSIIQSALCTIDQIVLYRQNSGTACFGVTTMPNPGVTSGSTKTRQYGSPSDTTMYIFDTYKITAGTGGKENTSLIPTKICGVNY